MRSPLTGLRFARLEFDNFRAGKMIKLAIVAISLIPLIYAGLFLMAFLDPYGNLVNVPAAVVNQDTGAEINGEQRNIGSELCDSLVENNEDRVEGQASGYNWKFVDESTAKNGLNDATYYMELIIPKDFSKNVASADSDNPTQAMLQVYFNPSTNLIAQTVGSSMVTKIKAELTNKIGEEYFKNIFLKISDAADQLQEAVDGTAELHDGLVSAKDGSQQLSDGLVTLNDGTSQLASATENLPNQTKQLADGASQLADGASQLADGTETLSDQTSALPSATGQLSDGASSLASGIGDSSDTSSETIYGAINQLKAGAGAINTGLAGLKSGLQQMRDGTSSSQGLKDAASGAQQIADGLAQAQESLKDLSKLTDAVSALNKYTSGLNTLSSTIASVADSIVDTEPEAAQNLYAIKAQLDVIINGNGTSSNPGIAGITSALNQALSLLDTSALEKAQQGAQALATGLNNAVAAIGSDTDTSSATMLGGVNQLLAGSSQLESGLEKVAGGLSSASSGATLLASNLGTLNSSSKKLVAGISTLNGGASALANGSSTLLDGTTLLANASKSLKSGIKQLDSGASTLASGSKSLVVGLGDAVDGTDTLKNGIADGQQEMRDNVKNSDEKASMMGTPVNANGDQETGESITHVSNYGTGFAPYFIGLGMWVGILMVTMLMNCLNKRILMSSASSISAVFASYVPIAGISCVQVLILLLFVQFGLKMQVNFVWQYYLFGILTALTFAAIIQFFRASLGTVGMVVVVILLMLQLCSAAGTFPIQTEIEFFQVISPYLPMTYVVTGFRMAMAGLSASYMTMPAVIMFAFMVVFIFFTWLVARHKRRASMATLYPPLKMAA